MPNDSFWSWIATFVIVVIGAVLRLVDLGWPPGKIFDEVYYATEGDDLFQHGVEWNHSANNADYVVHPPLGKWLIGLGEWAFRGHFNAEFGWRIAPAIAGIVSILIVIRLARRMFRSTVLGCAAGLLMALDGLHFVLSRSALLDIFLLLFVLAAFACLVMDRDMRRRRWLRAIEDGVDTTRRRPAWRWSDGVPWWRLGAGVMTGCAMAVKWSALWYIILFVLLIFWWELLARRSAGVKHYIRDTLLDEVGWVAAFGGIIVLVYLASWSGWFLTNDGWDRHWLASHGKPEPPILGALYNLYYYHHEALAFHNSLTAHHTYQSWPWQWLLLARPVAFYYSPAGPCGAAQCSSEVLLLGTPVLWWSFVPALALLIWFGISRRDWRALPIGLGAAAGIVPWFNWELDHRTMFYFYVAPAEPFLILAVVYVLGCLMKAPAWGGSRTHWPGGYEVVPVLDRRVIGAVIGGVYVLVVALCFGYFYPIYTGKIMTYAQWYARMWLGGRWI
ncbi:MAG: phospholipid carrier-dependent glycosyltransferase [Micromonosporaceae bacterium]|nr:phospholipid carrier-dependent glycosyltransferase [Micromonosporaceae bacterium]